MSPDQPDRPGPDDHAGTHDELPLEFYFAVDRVAEREDIEASGVQRAVLERVASARGFVGPRERSRIRLVRGAAVGACLLALTAAAVADRAGLAPWNGPARPGPVAALVASAAEGTSTPQQQYAQLREGLVNVRLTLATESAAAPVSGQIVRRTVFIPSEPVTERSPGPYFSSVCDRGPCEAASVIVFEDGLSVPAMRSASPGTLRWPVSSRLAEGVVLLDGLASATPPPGLSPAWYPSAGSGR